MFDGIKIQDISVSADLLLTNDRLLFALPIDEQTGAILDRMRRATDRGLSFTLIPRQVGEGYRVELTGSLHRYHNRGLHNADDFTVNNLLTALDQLVTTYNINPFLSRLNNLEFGVNVQLPFPVAQVLDNLVSYKNRPFYRDTRSETPYYQCETQRYIVKLYDKGHQYGLEANILRVEVKVEKMEYLTRKGITINALADLLTVTNYGHLGALLVDTFTEILFDDPTVKTATLTAKERNIYQDGRNPKFWRYPKGLTDKQAAAYRQRLGRIERQYRAIIDRHECGGWQTQTAGLIREKWEQLTTVDDDLLTRINERRAAWQTLIKPNFLNAPTSPVNCDNTVTELEKCHELTDPQKPELSQINPLYLGLKRDNDFTPVTIPPGAAVCPVTGVPIPTTTKIRRRGKQCVSATMLRNDDELLMKITELFKQYGKGSKEDVYSRTAHNIRNRYYNPRNNLRRRIERINRQPTLFDLSDTLRLTSDQRATLDHWKGTPYEVVTNRR